jgi:hypothetical protein
LKADDYPKKPIMSAVAFFRASAFSTAIFGGDQGFDIVYASEMNLKGLPIAKLTDPL